MLAARPGAVVADADDFPTDRYVLEGLAQARGRDLRMLRSDSVDGPQPEEVAAAVLYLASPAAEFASGAILDLNGASYLRT